MTLLAHFWDRVGRQLRCPTGRWGDVAGIVMAVVNRGPNQLAIDALGVIPTDTILELGFGPGRGIRSLNALAPRGFVIGIDKSRRMLAQASSFNKSAIDEGRVKLGLGYFDTVPLRDRSVDKILAVNVVYFFSDTGEEIREARRVLRGGGVMVIYVTDRLTMSKWKFSGPDTHSTFDGDDLRTLLLSGGFDPDEVAIRSVTLPFGVRGLLAVARKKH